MKKNDIQNRRYLTNSDIDNIISINYLNNLQKNKEIDQIYLANNSQQKFIYNSVDQCVIGNACRIQTVWNYYNSLDIDILKKIVGICLNKNTKHYVFDLLGIKS